jgi:hypothetical protein
MKIQQQFTSFAHPQANGQEERMNMKIVEGLKARLRKARVDWVEELPSVLWVVRTTGKTSTRQSPYIIVFGSETVIPVPVEVGVKTFRSKEVNEEENIEKLKENLDMLEERRESTRIKEARYKAKNGKVL